MLKRFSLAAAIALALAGAALAQSTSSFTNFVITAPSASLLPGCTDYVPITQGGLTKKLLGCNLGFVNRTNTWVQLQTMSSILVGSASGSGLGDGNVNAVGLYQNGVQVLTRSGSETITNKLISGASNTITNIPLSAFTNLGTATTVLHGNASGSPTFGAVSLTADISGILAGANGGTANGFMAFSGPTSSLKTFTLPDATATILTTNAAVTVAQGGTGAATLASNGILYGNGTSAVQALAINSTATNKFLRQVSSGAPSWQQPAAADITGLATVATSGSASDLSAGTLPTGRISGSYTGLTGTGTLTAGATGSGFTVALGTSTVSGILPAASGGAGTISGALKGNGSGTVSQAACADLSNGASGCSTAAAISATGTWTPVLKLGATTATISVLGANYTTFTSGLTVAVARIDITNKNSGTGAIIVTGLPTFNTQSYQGCSINYYGNFVGITGNVFAVEAGNGSTEVDLSMATSTGNTALLDTNLGANPGFGITCTYYH